MLLTSVRCSSPEAVDLGIVPSYSVEYCLQTETFMADFISSVSSGRHDQA